MGFRTKLPLRHRYFGLHELILRMSLIRRDVYYPVFIDLRPSLNVAYVMEIEALFQLKLIKL